MTLEHTQKAIDPSTPLYRDYTGDNTTNEDDTPLDKSDLTFSNGVIPISVNYGISRNYAAIVDLQTGSLASPSFDRITPIKNNNGTRFLAIQYGDPFELVLQPDGTYHTRSLHHRDDLIDLDNIPLDPIDADPINFPAPDEYVEQQYREYVNDLEQDLLDARVEAHHERLPDTFDHEWNSPSDSNACFSVARRTPQTDVCTYCGDDTGRVIEEIERKKAEPRFLGLSLKVTEQSIRTACTNCDPDPLLDTVTARSETLSTEAYMDAHKRSFEDFKTDYTFNTLRTIENYREWIDRNYNTNTTTTTSTTFYKKS